MLQKDWAKYNTDSSRDYCNLREIYQLKWTGVPALVSHVTFTDLLQEVFRVCGSLENNSSYFSDFWADA